jgi:LPXTG-motif cell wall-anchored protein
MKFGKALAFTSIGVAAVLTIATVPAEAATINTWGHWSFTDANTTNAGNLTFSTGQVNATWTALGDNGWSVDADTHATSEYFDAATPIASAFSANGPSSTNNYIRMYAGAGVNQQTDLFINFATPVPAGDLAIAVSDIDSDHMLVDGKDGSDNNIAVADLVGTAGSVSNLNALSFNFCADRTTTPCANNTDVVNVSQSTSTQLKFGDFSSNTWNTDGASVWIHPSTTVSSLRFQLFNGDTNESSERVWIVQKNEGAAPTTPTTPTGLANTGSDNLPLIALAGGLVATGYGMAATTRRRRSRR